MKSTTVFIPDGVYSDHVRTMLDEFVRFYQQMQSVGMERAVTFAAMDSGMSCVYDGDGVIRVTFANGEKLVFDDHSYYKNLRKRVHEHCEHERRMHRIAALREALETSAPQYAELDEHTLKLFKLYWHQHHPEAKLVFFGRNDAASDGFTGYINWEK